MQQRIEIGKECNRLSVIFSTEFFYSTEGGGTYNLGVEEVWYLMF